MADLGLVTGMAGNISVRLAVESFAQGFAGERPSDSTLETASMLVEAVMDRVAQKEIEVDDTDGTLTFELRLTNGLLVIGELGIDGRLNANVYNDRHPDACAGIEEIWVEHLPQTAVSDLIALFPTPCPPTGTATDRP